jgi:uncharacterized caspase-like protein
MSWREFESALVDFFRGHAAEITQEAGETFIAVLLNPNEDAEVSEISLSELAQVLANNKAPQ